MLRLVVPSPDLVHIISPHINQFASDTGKFQTNDVKRLVYAHKNNDWDGYFQKLHDDEHKINSHDGWLPTKTWWLMDNDNFVGVCSLRLGNTPELLHRGGNTSVEILPSMRGRGYGRDSLKLRIDMAKKLGMKSLLITCDANNIISLNNIKKIVQTYNGIETAAPNGEKAFMIKLSDK